MSHSEKAPQAAGRKEGGLGKDGKGTGAGQRRKEGKSGRKRETKTIINSNA